MPEQTQSQTNEAAKRSLEQSQAAAEKTRTDQEAAARGKPTPTQQENDLAALGAHVVDKEPDGSPEQPAGAPNVHGHAPQSQEQRTQEAAKPGGQAGTYQTRTMTARPPSPSKPAE